MADDRRRIGAMHDATHRQITVRHFGREPLPVAAAIRAEEIRAAREQQHLRHAALARYLNVTVGFVSQFERGTSAARARSAP